MELTVLASGSRGNGYILKGKRGESLLIEAGVPFKDYKKALNFNMRDVRACLVSHAHRDHARYIKEYEGIGIYSSKETFESLNMESYRLHAVNHAKWFNAGEFRVMPFDVKHDVQCFGYLIRHEECGSVLFATDTYYLPCTFALLNNILIECNYHPDILEWNTREGRISAAQRNRTLQSHMSYDTCLMTLHDNNLTAVNNIVLIHLSDDNSDEEGFVEGIANSTGKTTYAAKKGMRINFNKTPF
jgi:phosphoribosyl 1,2-cyclic phosphodiesterase